jgi:hypothetical protein
MKHEKLSIIPAPNRILIRITKQQIEDLISKTITKDDGTKLNYFSNQYIFQRDMIGVINKIRQLGKS